MKTPEMKQSGRMMARTTGCAASAFLTTERPAKPRQQKTTAPTMTSRRKAGPVRPGMCAPKPAQPMASKTAVSTSAVSAGDQGAAGDDRARGYRRRPSTLVDAGLSVADDRDDEIRERGGDETVGDDAGHVVDRLVDPPARHGDVLLLEHRREDRQEQDREGDREEHALLVAEKATQVGTELVHDEVHEAGAGTLDGGGCDGHGRASVSSR